MASRHMISNVLLESNQCMREPKKERNRLWTHTFAIVAPLNHAKYQ